MSKKDSQQEATRAFILKSKTMWWKMQQSLKAYLLKKKN